ncbi:oxidoreductase [Photobacterium rosenbergii]|uniref:Oxidoreductase n=1 Tax=Photobacterium rosenbergii TaxID=294936 RepID=A0A2T3NKP6_9GAMM|nr:SDR family oxidoreductase [Photobacterium rosenbergii]PSW16094.1 oxidoreductase [Photobacterium rosenbergii]
MAKYLITGASTGIGAETARKLAKGNELFLVYNRSKGKAEDLAVELENRGAKVQLFQANLTSEAACIKLFEEIGEVTDTLDAVVNNAGGMVQRQGVDELTWDTMLDVFNLNTFSLFKVTSLSVPFLKNSNKACIVNVTSIVVRHGGPTATLYGAAKGAVDTFTRGACRELAPHIRVNSVSPGVIETPFHDKVSTDEQMKTWAENNPLQRNGKASNIADAIHFCIENDFINGESIDINGGLFVR